MNTRKQRSILRWIIALIICAGLIVVLLRPARIDVETAVVDVGTITQELRAEGKVRLVGKYLVTMPINGELVVLNYHPGDSVSAGQILAYYRVLLLDERTRRELFERIDASRLAVAAASAQQESMQPELQHLEKQIGRLQRLVRQGASPLVELEQLQLRYNEACKLHEAAVARVAQTQHELQALQRGTLMPSGRGLPLRSPIAGVLLRLFEDQTRVLAAGMPVCEVGSLDSVEIVTDVLSRDAMQLRLGMKATLALGGGDTIPGFVQRIEPAARTKISALGIEEQRVDVVIKPEAPYLKLGDAFRADVDITLWKYDSTKRIPRNAILIDDRDTFCFTVSDGKAARQRLRVGRMSSGMAEVLSGVSTGATVVVNPARALTDGARVRMVP